MTSAPDAGAVPTPDHAAGLPATDHVGLCAKRPNWANRAPHPRGVAIRPFPHP